MTDPPAPVGNRADSTRLRSAPRVFSVVIIPTCRIACLGDLFPSKALPAGKSIDAAASTLKMPERFSAYGMEWVRDVVAAVYGELKP